MLHADRFSSRLLSGPLGVAPERSSAVGTDLQIIDFHYEALLSRGDAAPSLLAATTRRLQDAAGLAAAAASIPALEDALADPSCALLEVARAAVASLTVLGHGSLSKRVSSTAADRWLALWRDALLEQDQQQELHCGLCLLARAPEAARPRLRATLGVDADALRPGCGDFRAGVAEYLARFSETGALAVLLIGGIAFAEGPRPAELEALLEFIPATPEYLRPMTALLRLAADVRFDPEEPLSTGVYAVAAEMGKELVDVDARALARRPLDARLDREWTVVSAELRRRVDEVVARPRHRRLRPVLTDLASAVFSVGQEVLHAPHKSEVQSEP
ncbi:MAG: hypothetical protein R3B09_05820 [Nannocystaceae bacterium]